VGLSQLTPGRQRVPDYHPERQGVVAIWLRSALPVPSNLELTEMSVTAQSPCMAPGPLLMLRGTLIDAAGRVPDQGEGATRLCPTWPYGRGTWLLTTVNSPTPGSCSDPAVGDRVREARTRGVDPLAGLHAHDGPGVWRGDPPRARLAIRSRAAPRLSPIPDSRSRISRI